MSAVAKGHCGDHRPYRWRLSACHGLNMRRNTVLALIAVLALAASIGANACGSDDDVVVDTTSTLAPGANGGNTTTSTTAPDFGSPAANEADQAALGFMNARAAGSGAEGFVTAEGLATYRQGTELYNVASFEITGLEAVDANSFQVTVAITGTDGGTRTETLFVGPGQLVDGTNAAMAVRGGVVD